MFHWWHQVRDGTLAHATLKLQHRHVLHVLDYLPAASEAAHAGKPRRPCYQALDQLKKIHASGRLTQLIR
jgi:hypothetical protein